MVSSLNKREVYLRTEQKKTCLVWQDQSLSCNLKSRESLLAMTDLSEALGYPFEYDHPEVWRAVDRIVNKAHARGIIVAANIGYAFTTPDQIIERVHKLHQHGIRICLMQGADVMFENHAKALLSEVRGVLS